MPPGEDPRRSSPSGDGARFRRPSSPAIDPSDLSSPAGPIIPSDAMQALADVAAAVHKANLSLVALGGRLELIEQRIDQVEKGGSRRGRELEQKIEAEVRGLQSTLTHAHQLSDQDSSARREALEGRVQALEEVVSTAKGAGSKIIWMIVEKVISVGLPWGAIAALWWSSSAATKAVQ